MPSTDPTKLRAAQRRYRTKHQEAINARQRAVYPENREQHLAKQQRRRREHRTAVLAYNRLWSKGYRTQLRAEMIAAYGGKCVCCGETEPCFLQIDHIENDGAAERRTLKTSHHLAGRLKKLGWPKDRYQLLCANCNFGKLMNGGTCPHHANDQS